MKSKTDLAQWIDGKSEFPKDQDGRETYEKIKLYSTHFESPHFKKEKVFESIKASQKSKLIPKQNHKSLILKIAAVLIIGIGIFELLSTFGTTTYQTNSGVSKVISLPDNSQVLIQAESILSFNSLFWILNRNVELEGEAFFDVADGETFTVETPKGKVQVLGTQFNVSSFENRLTVACYEGRVEVRQNETMEVIGLNEFIILKSGSIDTKKQFHFTESPMKSDYYEIFDAKFENLVKDIERYYNVNIDVSQIKLDKTFTGKLPKNDILKTLNIISKTYQFEYKNTSGNNFIFVEDESVQK